MAEQQSKKSTSKLVHFYFPKSAGATFTHNKVDADGNSNPLTVRAKNHVLTLDPATAEGKHFISALKKDKANKANGGVKFMQIEDPSGPVSDIAKSIDDLMAMDESSLITMLGGDIELHRMSKGGLIAKALKLKG